ncbi:MAG: endonuclease/exonuclease/phosphatase family protein [Fimbriimonadaceae bacterium]|nr:endonuclease/exonuclease/phosphatase family protein [Chitinophagales bacterium]
MANVLLRWMDLYTWRIIFSVSIIAFSLILAFQPDFWIFDAMDALRIPYAIVLTAFTMFVFIRGNKMLATSGAIALLILTPGIWQYFKTGQAPVTETKKEIIKKEIQSDFSVVHFNVKENNKNILSVAKTAMESNADILSFQELNQQTLDPINEMLKEKYPYNMSDLSIKGYGMAIYSKYPITDTKVIVQHNFPLLTGKVNIGENTFQFISATVSSPKNEKGFEEQKKQFKVIGAYADSVKLPLVVMGDMNAVPWSEEIETFTKETKLKDSRKDLASTFPSNSIIQVPIDYIFHSTDLNCVDFGTLKQTSSNHLGIIGYYKFKNLKQ